MCALPTGFEVRKAVFSTREAERLSDSTLLNLENNHIRGLAMNRPQVALGQPIPCVRLEQLPASLSGSWGCMKSAFIGYAYGIGIFACSGRQKRLPVCFREVTRERYLSQPHDISGIFCKPPPAQVVDVLESADSMKVHNELYVAAENTGQEVFESMRLVHRDPYKEKKNEARYLCCTKKKLLKKSVYPKCVNSG